MSAKRMSQILWLATLLSATAAQAKPLYVTVPRSFGSNEPVIVDVAFEDTEPVELRITKPTNLEAFIASQANLRRVYAAPSTTLNPGKYLSMGLDRVRAPARYFLYSLPKKLRETLSPSIPSAGEDSADPIGPIEPGPDTLVSFPPGTEIVSRRWLNLDLGGTERTFSVPGFELWTGRSGFAERRVSLGTLPTGVYVVQLVQGRIEGQVLLVVTDLSVMVKQTDGEVMVRVAGRDQLPKAGVEIRAMSGKIIEAGTTNADGEARLAISEPKLIVTAKSGRDVALVDTDFYSTLAVAPDVFLYTDRPIFRPGDTVHFRALARRPGSFLSRLFEPKQREVTVSLEATEEGESRPKVASKVTARLDEFGSFEGKLEIPEDAATGVLRAVAKLDEHEHQAEARVEAYVKPTFYLELDPESETVSPGEQIKAKLRARRYSGGIPEGVAYDVFLYRTILETPAWVDDAGLGAQGSAVTYGSASTNEGGLAIPKRLYSSLEERLAVSYTDDPWSTAPEIGESGEIEITVNVPPLDKEDRGMPIKYALTVRARDKAGTYASITKAFHHADCEVLGSIFSPSRVVVAGQQISLSVRSTTLPGRPIGGIKGTLELTVEKANGTAVALPPISLETAEDGVWRGKVLPKDAGNLRVKATLTDRKGAKTTTESQVLVAGTSGEPILNVPALTVESLPKPLEPDESARVIAMLPDEWGPGGKNEGHVWVTLEGAGIFETRRIPVRGRTLIHDFSIERRFGSAVYASLAVPTAVGRWDERIVPFRVVPRERVLGVSVEPTSVEVPPMADQTIRVRVVDYAGKPTRASVSLGVVDKAIYALQTELRPTILDFYYPITRDNVTSFFSSEFQGYGYGDYLARLQKFEKRAFAAVKPPAKKSREEEKDTAFWRGSILTDESGVAEVTFRMPSNQTIWVATAVAADTEGRFGEGKSEFASRGKIELVASMPAFLRAGDRSEARIRISRPEKSDAKSLSLTVQASTLGLAPKTEPIDLSSNKERVVSVSLEAKAQGPGTLELKLTGLDSDLTTKRQTEVRAGTVVEDLRVSGLGGGELKLDVPPGAKVEAVDLEIMPTTVAIAMSSVRDLLTYPYGCLEQLVSTTIPNIAVVRTLEKAGTLGSLDDESRRLLEVAKSRAVEGTERILDLSLPGGGFTWFKGYADPSLPLTVIAIDGIAHAVEADLVKVSDVRVTRSTRWLEAQSELPPLFDAARVLALARLEGRRHADRARLVVERAEAEPDPVVAAFAVLAAEQAGIYDEAALRPRLDALVAKSAAALPKLADLSFNDVSYWQYPLGRTGAAALLASAARKGTADPEMLRGTLIRTVADAGELSTFDRATLLMSSLWLVESDAKLMRKLPAPDVSVNGQSQKIGFGPRGGGLVGSLPVNANVVKVSAFDGIAQLRARSQTPIAEVKPQSEGLTLERKFYAIRQNALVPIASGDAVTEGEEIFVELEFDAPAGPKRRSAYTVLEDAIPAGFVAIREDKAFEGAPLSLPLRHESLRTRSLGTDRATFFFEEPAPWSNRPRSFGYVLRAEFPGEYQVPPAKIADMYAPSVFARSAPAKLTIKPVQR